MKVIPDQYQLQQQPQMPVAQHGDTLHRRRSTQAESIWLRFLRAGGASLLWLEPFWITALLPSLLLRDYLWDAWVHPWLVAALFLFWPLRLLLMRQLSPYTTLTWPIGLLLAWSSIGVVGSPDPERSWTALGYLVVGIALYFALVNWSLTQRYPWLLLVLLGGCGIILVAFGPALLINVSDEFFIFSEELVQSKPLDAFGTGETINPNVLGGTLALLIPLLLAISIQWNGCKNRWLRYIIPSLASLLTIALLTTLILAQSRGAYLAASVGIVVVLIARWPWSALVLAIALGATTVVLAGNGAMLFVEAIGTSGSITSLSGRWEVWERALYAIRDFPLTGIGMGTFEQAIPLLYPYVEMSNSAQIPHAHNLWLQVGVDLGLPGLIFYTWLLVNLFRGLRRQMRHATQVLQANEAGSQVEPGERRRQRHDRRQLHRTAAWQWTMAVGLLGAFTALLVDGLVDAVTWGAKPAFVTWLLISLAALLFQHEQGLTTEE